MDWSSNACCVTCCETLGTFTPDPQFLVYKREIMIPLVYWVVVRLTI